MFKKIASIVVCTLCIYALGDLYLIINSNSKKEAARNFINLSGKKIPANILKAYNKVYHNASSNKVKADIIWYLINRGKLNDYAQFNFAYQRTFSSGAELFCYAIALSNVSEPIDCIENYLNKFDFLNNTIGIENAATYYYKKNLNELDESESLELIAMLDNPAYYNKFSHPEHLKKRLLFIQKNNP